MMVKLLKRVKWKMLHIHHRYYRDGLLALVLLVFLSIIVYEIVQKESVKVYRLADKSKLRQEEIISLYLKELQRDRDHNNSELNAPHSEPVRETLAIPPVTFPPDLGLKLDKVDPAAGIKFPGKLSTGVDMNKSSNNTNGRPEINKGDLEGGPGHCQVYNHRKEIKDEFDCVALRVQPVVFVCLYDDKEDVHISAKIREEGVWEPHIVSLFQEKLRQDPDVGFIDIGANIGEYSLIAAQMGHSVVAVEPFSSNLKRLHKAIKLNRLEDRITVVSNAVSFSRESLQLRTHRNNQGGVILSDEFADPWCNGPLCPAHTVTILMDDLLEVINFNKAIIKIDIEGFEHKAFAKSSKLLEKTFVPYIFMEWIKLREYYKTDMHESLDKKLVSDFIRYLTENNYQAYSSVNGEYLEPPYWFAWTDDIIWKHQNVTSAT